jgi:hypothetical protein
MARRAHYSATTLSVACSGTALPSLEVTLAFVRVCGGDEEVWRDRWNEVVGQRQCRQGVSADAEPTELISRRLARSRLVRVLPSAGLSIASAATALLVAGFAGLYQSVASPRTPPAASSPAVGLPPGYIGVSRCDPGSYPVMQNALRLPRPILLGGHGLPVGTVIGTVILMYSPECSEAWPHFSPATEFFNQAGELTLRSRSTPDNALNTSPEYPVIRYADGEPMLTIPGCVEAEATVRFASGLSVSAATACFQRA